MAEIRDDFKNTPIDTQERGLHCEALVAQFLLRKGLRFCGHRVRTPFAEIDLVFAGGRSIADPQAGGIRSTEVAYLIEVKSLSNPERIANLIHNRQKRRLRRAMLYWQERHRIYARFFLAAVDYRGKITWIEDFLS